MFMIKPLALPETKHKLLLHSCCAPCVGSVMERLKASHIEFSIFFYNPNIHPKKEYELRKDENKRYADDLDIPFIDADYDVDRWFERTKGLGCEPERGIRCSACFDMRFERTALYAFEHGFDLITSSLGLSRWKDFDQINHSGCKSASHYEGIDYWTFNWRKQGGSERMYSLSKEEHFYKQEYCGCVYSLRDTNAWREENGRDKIEMGTVYY